MPAATSNPNAKSSSYWQQTAQNRMLLVVLGMVVLVPLLASPSNAEMQGIAQKALQVMAALLAGILVMRARVATRKAEVITFLGTGPNLAILLYFVSCVISLLLGPKEPEIRRFAFSELQRILAGILLYFALTYHIRRSEHLVKILDALVMVCGLMAVLGLVTINVQGIGSKTTLFGDHQLFGAFLMILFPVPLIAALTERDTQRRIIAIVTAALTAIGLLMTGTRTAWLGAVAIVVALSIFSLIRPPRREAGPSSGRQFVIPLLTVIACAVFFIALGGSGSILGLRMRSDSTTESMAYRRRMWYAAERLILVNPAFGTGLGTYPVYQQAYSQNGRPQAVVLQNSPTLAEMAHNFWLQTAAEQGLVGATLFGVIVVTFLIAGARRLRYMEGGRKRSLLLACLSGIVGFSVDAVGNPAWQFAQVSMFFWLILGLGVASLRPRAARQDN